MENKTHKGRFAPSPTGRMHLGNAFSALLSWLSAKSKGGQWLLRIEDLDRSRSRMEYALQIEDDLRWLGLDRDEGGTQGRGDAGPYLQSLRDEIYERHFRILYDKGLVYPCYCTRADILASQAPHESDGRVVYAGTCRPASLGGRIPESQAGAGAERFPQSLAGAEAESYPQSQAGAAAGGVEATNRQKAASRVPAQELVNCAGANKTINKAASRAPAQRLFVPSEEIAFIDGHYGPASVNLARECGDFIVRRSDGGWAYQLAVVADDALMGVTEVVRGRDLLLSSPQQIYLYRLLGYAEPSFCHLPLLCSASGERLCKRDRSLDLGELRRHISAEQLIGRLAFLAGQTDHEEPLSATELLSTFSWSKVPLEDIRV